MFHGPPVGAHLAENILFGNNISFEQEWPRKLGWILFGSWMFKMCEIILNIRQNIHGTMVGARGTLQNSTYSKTWICFKFTIFTRYTPRLFSICDTFHISSKLLFLSKAIEASKVSPSAVITAEQKISKSNFAQNITSNVIFRLPEGQPTHWLSFSIFEIFVLPSKFFMPQ